MRLNHPFQLTLLLAVATIAPGCATPVKTPSSENTATGSPAPTVKVPPEAASHSSLDITYMLGHDVHRLRIEAAEGHVRAQTFVDHQVLKDTQVDRARYLELLGRAMNFMAGARRPASNAPCRTPFTLIVQLVEKAETLSGCRVGEEGSQLSRITRDAEFLLYSKN